MFFVFFFSLLITSGEANVRCYSCAPCNEFDFYAGSVYHFEQDCYFDRYCLKVNNNEDQLVNECICVN